MTGVPIEKFGTKLPYNVNMKPIGFAEIDHLYIPLEISKIGGKKRSGYEMRHLRIFLTDIFNPKYNKTSCRDAYLRLITCPTNLQFWVNK